MGNVGHTVSESSSGGESPKRQIRKKRKLSNYSRNEAHGSDSEKNSTDCEITHYKPAPENKSDNIEGNRSENDKLYPNQMEDPKIRDLIYEEEKAYFADDDENTLKDENN